MKWCGTCSKTWGPESLDLSCSPECLNEMVGGLGSSFSEWNLAESVTKCLRASAMGRVAKDASGLGPWAPPGHAYGDHYCPDSTSSATVTNELTMVNTSSGVIA